MSESVIFSKSEDIGVFPLAEYRTKRPHDNALSERNLSEIILSTLDRDSFVVSNSLSLPIDDFTGSLQFVISGYLISLTNLIEIEDRLKDKLPSGVDVIGDVYASIEINLSDGSAPYLMGSDEDEDITTAESYVFSGVHFSYSAPSQLVKVETVGQSLIKTVALHILHKQDGKWTIPPESLLKLDTGSISGIDGGEIE